LKGSVDYSLGRLRISNIPVYKRQIVRHSQSTRGGNISGIGNHAIAVRNQLFRERETNTARSARNNRDSGTRYVMVMTS
jgi:hypothetical protein